MVTTHELDDEQEYEAEIDQCVGVTGYHYWFFLSALAEAFNLEFRAFAVDLDGERLGVVPLLFRCRGPVSIVNILPIGCIGPVLRGEAFRAGRVRELVSGVEPVLCKYRTLETRWAFSPELSVSPEHLAMPGFDIESWENYVIRGNKSVDDLLKSMSRSRRQSINRHMRRAQARGVAVEEALAVEVTRWLPGQIAIAYERQGIKPLYTSAKVHLLTERLASHPRMLWRAVKEPDGKVIGMAGCVIGEDRLWGWLIAGRPVQGISVQLLCYWDLIQLALDRGLALDLGGAPNEGIRELKTSLGADKETAVAAHRVRYKAVYKAGLVISNGIERLAEFRLHQS